MAEKRREVERQPAFNLIIFYVGESGELEGSKQTDTSDEKWVRDKTVVSDERQITYQRLHGR